MTEIVTDRLTLREFTPADAAGVFAILGDPRVTATLSFDATTREQADARLAGIVQRQSVEPRPECYLAITPTDATSDVLGFCRLGFGGVKAASLGIAVRADSWRRGIAREAACALITHGFDTLDLHRITAEVGPRNTPSLALVRGLGFTREGVIRDHVFTNGAWRDSVSHSLLAPEWQAMTCRTCGQRAPHAAGRPRRYCGDACRQAAYRARHSSGSPTDAHKHPEVVH